MTRKHFEKVASVISEMSNRDDAWKMYLICVDIFSSDNPNFDAVRFSIACGFNPEGDE